MIAEVRSKIIIFQDKLKHVINKQQFDYLQKTNVFQDWFLLYLNDLANHKMLIDKLFPTFVIWFLG